MSSNLPANIKVKPEIVKISDIESNTFVRTGIDPDRVQFLGTLVESGVVLEPILLIPAYELDDKGRINLIAGTSKRNVVNGRHRLRMYDFLLDHDEVKALTIVSGVETEVQLISLAFQSNMGGALPPTQGDISHTVASFLERGVFKKDIPALLGMPEVAVKKFINDVEAQLERAKVSRAVKRVLREDITTSEAAKLEKTTPEKVRSHIAAGRRRERETSVAAANKDVAHALKVLSSTVHTTMRHLFRKYDDGDVVADDVRGVFRKIDSSGTTFTKAVKDLRARFEDKVSGNGRK